MKHKGGRVNKAKTDPLVGKFFHQMREGETIGWQGIVEGIVSEEPKRYLLRLFSWLDGSTTDQQIVALNDMLTWIFYDSSDAMKYGYEAYAHRNGFKYDAEQDIEFGKMLRGENSKAQ